MHKNVNDHPQVLFRLSRPRILELEYHGPRGAFVSIEGPDVKDTLIHPACRETVKIVKFPESLIFYFGFGFKPTKLNFKMHKKKKRVQNNYEATDSLVAS